MGGPTDQRTDTSAVLLENGHVRIKRTRYGLMAYNVNDTYLGRSLDRYGEYVPGQMAMLGRLARPGCIALDVGANIGPITLFLSQAVGPRGHVIAIEPQRGIYQLLCANLALNGIENVHAIHAGASRASGHANMPAMNYSQEGNFGGGGLRNDGKEPVNVITIDSLELPTCRLIKIDVEGHELAVIEGARETIARWRPALYVENDRRERSPDLIRLIEGLDYVLYWHLPPLYEANNFYRSPTNLWPDIVSIDVVCVPRDRLHGVTTMTSVKGPDDWPDGLRS